MGAVPVVMDVPGAGRRGARRGRLASWRPPRVQTKGASAPVRLAPGRFFGYNVHKI
ncbi:MAG: hypothetical protein HSCHL_0128 [Hydrogenibacillus schlegelii]|uniref:Uncharacterized protein n=1 Tax=Hydrogenibacillus schlegelii TaxID=1484 RepID=A0A2T5GEF1_HYDSH|nr:MAG: hypothetical protein HSCHL_0128 [Hydrogenibacillus schlegelii]